MLLSLIVPALCSLGLFLRLSFFDWQFGGVLLRWFVGPPLIWVYWMCFLWLDEGYELGKIQHRWSPSLLTGDTVLVAWSQWYLPGSALLISSFSFICFVGQKGWASVLVGAIAIHISSWRCLPFSIYLLIQPFILTHGHLFHILNYKPAQCHLRHLFPR